ncbi:MAG: hypothetical protein BWY52_03064 [Chloroflexi bacterium ADurb.Bin325]|nr:MAG: hypothetical protein BWY52_03064 [Chloroflexi bacterium ADurb.Bin325]
MRAAQHRRKVAHVGDHERLLLLLRQPAVLRETVGVADLVAAVVVHTDQSVEEVVIRLLYHDRRSERRAVGVVFRLFEVALAVPVVDVAIALPVEDAQRHIGRRGQAAVAGGAEQNQTGDRHLLREVEDQLAAARMTEQQERLIQVDAPAQVDGQLVVRQRVEMQLDELRDEVVADVVEVDPVNDALHAENVVGVVEVDGEGDVALFGQRADKVGFADVEARLRAAGQTKRDVDLGGRTDGTRHQAANFLPEASVQHQRDGMRALVLRQRDDALHFCRAAAQRLVHHSRDLLGQGQGRPAQRIRLREDGSLVHQRDCGNVGEDGLNLGQGNGVDQGGNFA